MGKLSACLALALAACGSSNSKKPDAQIIVPDAAPDAKIFLDAPIDAPPVFDFSCVNNPAPTTATANVSISGNAQEVGINGSTPTFTPLSGATVDACQGNCSGNGPGNAHLAMTTTDISGNFTAGPIATGMTPLTAYLKLTPPTPTTGSPDMTVLEYPAEPVTADLTGIPLFTLTSTAAQDLALLGCTSTSTQGMLAVLLTDCSNMPITDTTHTQLIVKQGGTDITANLTVISLGQFSSMAAGTYLLCKVPANATTSVGATYTQTMTTTFLAHDVAVVAGEITATQIRPGY